MMVRFIPFLTLTLTLALTATLALTIGCGPSATTDTGAGAAAATATTVTDATASQPAPANALTVTDAPPASVAGQTVTTTATESTESTAVTAPVQTPAGAPDNISPVGGEPEPEAVEPTLAPIQLNQLNPPDSADAPTPPAAAVVDLDTAITVTPVAPDRVAPANPVAAVEPSGSAAPRFSLPSANYETVALDSYIGEKNVVLVFYRAFW